MNMCGSFVRCSFNVIGLLAMGLLAGCGGDGGGSGGAQAGVVSVSLTDAPACGFDQVNVTVNKVRIHQSDSANEQTAGWTDITLNPPRKINLLNLNDPTQPNFALETLGEAPLPAGHYTQVRLVLAANQGNSLHHSVVLSSSPATEIPLETPSAVQSGIKLIHQFDVGSGQRVDLLLDFDACKSIVHTGNGAYKLKPVIKVIPTVLNGIDGFISPSLFVNHLNAHHVVITAQVNGEVVRATVPNPATGRFWLARLDPATYDVVITADDHATAVIAGVPVASTTSMTPVSTSGAPLSLSSSTPARAISGTVTLNPATDDETVVAAAKQSLSGGPIVTVRARPSALVAGNPPGDFTYSLDQLPTGAPSLGTYGPLPITLSAIAQSGVAGKYTVQASATGFKVQSFNTDVSASDATQPFALIP